jgi:hypothetical protein
MDTVLLDRNGDAALPAGYRLVQSEVEFLRMATTGERLMLRGDALCDWAETYYRGRQIAVQEVRSPVCELKTVFPEVTTVDAQLLLAKLGEQFERLPRPLRAGDVLQTLHPTSLWAETPSLEHAAQYLLWVYQVDPGNMLRPPLQHMCKVWQQQMPEKVAGLYAAFNKVEALTLLDGWLGISPSDLSLSSFPLKVPTELENRARTTWNRQIIESHGGICAALLTQPIPVSLKRIIVQEALAYYLSHRADLTRSQFNQITPYLSIDEQRRLSDLLPPPYPMDLPETVEDVLEWFEQEYLPFRVWGFANSSEEVTLRLTTVARQFANWYLDQYSQALMGGVLKPRLSFSRSATLISKPSKSVMLLIVLDGLHVKDGQTLLRLIQERISRLTSVSNHLVFAPLPTITMYCKEALLRGLPPAQVNQAERIGQVFPEGQSAVDKLQTAQPGELYIWSVLEPDHTYHERTTLDVLQRDVEAQLEGVARKIEDIVSRTASDRSLEIIITTDHGRLLGVSPRVIPVPDGLTGHGRAAWGTVSREFPSQGYWVENDLVYLDAERFGLPNDVCMPLGEETFLRNDGRKGKEIFSHGGIFPEEVIVPWIVLARDVKRPEIDIKITGRARAGKTGTLQIFYTNLGDVEIALHALELHTGADAPRKLKLDVQVLPRSSETYLVELPVWPGSANAAKLKAIIMASQSNQVVFEITAQVELQSDEMYQQENPLEDLL